MFRKIIMLFISLCLMFGMSGCNPIKIPEDTESHIWLVAMNERKADHLEIILDVSTGYTFRESYKLPKGKDPKMSDSKDFIVMDDRVGIFKDDELISEILLADVSTFVKEEVIREGKEIETGKVGLSDYIFWSNNNIGYHHIVIIPGSDTAFVIRNLISEESARDCFSMMMFLKIG